MIGNVFYGCYMFVFVIDILYSYIDILKVLDLFFGYI